MNQHTLFTTVQDCYTDLVAQLAAAQQKISMGYFSFEQGEWTDQILGVLHKKIKAGVRVRLMVDELGQRFDEPRTIPRNFQILKQLQALGVQVDIFKPARPLHILNRLHVKFTAIDDRTLFLGGSNIGDYYITWNDTNLRVDGELGDAFHRVYDLLAGFSKPRGDQSLSLDLTSLQRVGNERLHLTIPGNHFGVRTALLDLIRQAESALFIRAWYFLPEDDILEALCRKAQEGVHVNVLLSHRTRVRAIDFANYLHVHKLVCAGGEVHRYTGKYMHSKAIWNEKGHILFGSANFNATSMQINFETCLEVSNPALAWELRRSFHADCAASLKQTPESHLRRSLADQALTHACNLASPWL
jgi:cardiolipin synthase